jgi:alpha-amylase/alpha-mannosidase (GH57 family)
MERYICIHGHFYQPPRESPWLEAVELQDSAYPYHDWNERITAECYAPNGASRILGSDGQIEQIVNNYSRISFNFGPTLLAWLERFAASTYQAVLDADRESQKKFGGHGSALAQAYNHIIMPLANDRDKETQVVWGIRDFERRFRRKPEGMWLPETAVDLATLELLATHGIHFTILSPYQARRVRPVGGRAWRSVQGGRVDPSMAYRMDLPSGRTINIFFYDAPVSQAVAFERLLLKGDYLAGRILSAFSETRMWPQLAHIATDGESYGHHSRFGDMALAYALHHIETNQLARLTNYAEFLEKHPPTHEAEIFENSSWSCVHGVERWRSNCGCNSGGHAGWNQEWRAPLRLALDWLRDTLSPAYEAQAHAYLKDPWVARNDYIDVVLDRSRDNVNRFLAEHQSHNLSENERVTALKLLELQRHALLMFTSCGWFFDELSGIESVQVLRYAGRALQLGMELFGDGMEEHFLAILEQGKSNLAEYGDGRRIYEKFVRPEKVDLLKVGAHYAISSLFEEYEERSETYCYTVVRHGHKLLSQGKARLALGNVLITSQLTGESAKVTFGVLHLGDHNLSGGIRNYLGEEAYRSLVEETTEVFNRGDLAEIIRHVDKSFGSDPYSLKLLFHDQQRKILRQILDSTLTEVEAAYRQVYQNNAALMRFLGEAGIPFPRALEIATEFTLNTDLRRALRADDLNLEKIKTLRAEAEKARVPLDNSTLEFALRRTIERMAIRFTENPEDTSLLQKLEAAVDLAGSFSFEVSLWTVQNCYYDTLQNLYPRLLAKAESGDDSARQWVEQFRSLGAKLRVRVER